MNSEEVRAAIESALAGKVTLGWWQLGIFVVVAGLAAYLGAYLKRRGENRAMNESFDAIRAQLQHTTRDTEEIKNTMARATWLSQTKWIAREKFYSVMMTHLRQLEISLSDQCDFFREPGSELDEATTSSDGYQKMTERAWESTRSLREMLGPAALHLSDSSLSKVERLLNDLWHIGEESVCTADYVRQALNSVSETRKLIQTEARWELFQKAES